MSSTEIDPNTEEIPDQNDSWYLQANLELDKRAFFYLSFISLNNFSRRKVYFLQGVSLSQNNQIPILQIIFNTDAPQAAASDDDSSSSSDDEVSDSVASPPKNNNGKRKRVLRKNGGNKADKSRTGNT